MHPCECILYNAVILFHQLTNFSLLHFFPMLTQPIPAPLSNIELHKTKDSKPAINWTLQYSASNANIRFYNDTFHVNILHCSSKQNANISVLFLISKLYYLIFYHLVSAYIRKLHQCVAISWTDFVFQL